MLDMYSTKLEKHDSLEFLQDLKFSSEGRDTLSHETVYYSQHRKLDPVGVEHLWLELSSIKTGHILLCRLCTVQTLTKPSWLSVIRTVLADDSTDHVLYGVLVRRRRRNFKIEATKPSFVQNKLITSSQLQCNCS